MECFKNLKIINVCHPRLPNITMFWILNFKSEARCFLKNSVLTRKIRPSWENRF